MKLASGLRQIASYGLGFMATKVISLLMVPFVTSWLSPHEYGTLEILQVNIYLISIVVGFGMSDAIFRFGATAKTPQLMEEVCSNAITLTLIISLPFSLVLILFAKQIAWLLPGNVTSWQIIYLSIALGTNTLLGVQLAWIRLKKDANRYALINFFSAFILAVLVVLMLITGYGVTGMMFASAFANLVVYLYVRFFLLKVKSSFNPDWQKKLFVYGFPLIFGGMAEFITLWLPNLWLAYVIPVANMAIYALAMKFSLFTGMLMTPFTLWWYPKRFELIETAEKRINCARRTENGVAGGFLVALLITILGAVFIKLFIRDAYHQAISYLPWTCLLFAFKIGGELMNTGIFLTNTKIAMWINTVFALVTLVGLYFLTPLLHVWGVILVLNFVFFFRWFFYVFLSQKELYLPYQYLPLFILTTLTLVSMVAFSFMTTAGEYILIGGVLWLLCALYCYVSGLLPNISELIHPSERI